MPASTIGREITRGTLCRDQWRADVRIACSDRIAVGGRSDLFVGIAWRRPRADAPVPDDTNHAPVALRFTKRSEAATGDVRFDAPDGPSSKGFVGDTQALLPIFGAGASAGAADDLSLEVAIEGEVRASLPLSVGAPAATLEIRAENGSDPAPDAIPVDTALRLRAVATPTGPGEYHWFGLPGAAVEARAPADGSVEVVGHRFDPPGGALCVTFVPAAGRPVVFIAKRVAVEAAPGAVTYRGRLVDTIGLPVAGARVTVRSWSGHPVAEAEADAGGRFALQAQARGETVLTARSAGTQVEVPLAAPGPGQAAVDLGDVRLRLAVALAGTVGDGGDNQGIDVRRVQDRLNHLGRLSDADVETEPAPLTADPVAVPMPRLWAAIYDHMRAATGQLEPLVRPDDPTLRSLNAEPPFPPGRLVLSGPVGELPGAAAPPPDRNRPADVGAVQDRLHQLGLLTDAEHRAERVDPATAPAPVDSATLPRTVEALRQFELRVVGGALRAVLPGDEGLRLLNDPYWSGRLSLPLARDIGQGGENRAADVCALQVRLRDLELLADDAHAAELVTLPDPPAAPPDAIADRDIGSTIAALGRFRELMLGVPAPADARVEVEDRALARLNGPSPAGISAGVGVGEQGLPADNRPRDVRAIQDRLRLLTFLQPEDWRRERVSLDRRDAPAFAAIAQTFAALSAFHDEVLRERAPDAGAAGQPVAVRPSDRPRPLALRGAVGEGQANAPADVRKVQDRLLALRALAPSDHDRERVDPAAAAPVAPGALAATFAAIRSLRERVLGLPRAAAGKPWTAQAVVAPGDETNRLLDDPLFYGRRPLRLAGSVGAGGWNHPADVRAVQDRLGELGLLGQAGYERERLDPTRRTGPVDPATLADTLAAIARFRQDFLDQARTPERIEPRDPTLRALENPLLPLPRLAILPQPATAGGATAPGVAQPRRRRPRDALALDPATPRSGLVSLVDLSGSVGPGGDNDLAEVRAVQDRLRDLRFLTEEDHGAEAVRVADTGVDFSDPPAPPVTPAPGAIRRAPRTRHAIELWRERMPGLAAAGTLEPATAALRLLNRPTLPRPVTLAVALPVRNATPTGPPANHNDPGDVRRVQERLHRLGYLRSRDYLAERIAAAGAGPVYPGAATQAALLRFQGAASGRADGVISVGGVASRALDDPTWGTASTTNPHTGDQPAGPAMPDPLHPVPARHREIVAIIEAIERQEGGTSVGEIPAILRNSSRTPASFGKGQVVGPTGLGRFRAAGAIGASLQRFYGLDDRELDHLEQIVDATRRRYEDIFALVPAGPAAGGVALGGLTEADLRARIGAYRQANLADFHAATGLGAANIEAMFRAAQFRRHMAVHIAGQALPAQTPAGAAADAIARMRRFTALASMGAFLAPADVATNVRAMDLSATMPPPPPPPPPALTFPPPVEPPRPRGASDVYAYLRVRIENEILNGFLTRALLTCRYGQTFRAALTDASGFKLGRIVIRDNFASVLNDAGGGALSREDRMRVTAQLHNAGGNVATLVANPPHNQYTNSVRGFWVDPGP